MRTVTGMRGERKARRAPNQPPRAAAHGAHHEEPTGKTESPSNRKLTEPDKDRAATATTHRDRAPPEHKSARSLKGRHEPPTAPNTAASKNLHNRAP